MNETLCPWSRDRRYSKLEGFMDEEEIMAQTFH
jgi:hypothetical protein